MAWWESQLGKASDGDGAEAGGRFVEVTAQGEVVVASRLELEVAGIKLRVPSDFDDRAVIRMLGLLEARR